MKKNTVRPHAEEIRESQAATTARGECQRVMQTGLQEMKRGQMLPASLERFMLLRQIDSFHKVWLLLFFHQRSHEDGINREYLRQVTFADAQTLNEAVDELQDAGLLIATGEALSLRDALEVRSDLDTMARVFEDPLGRQDLLRRLYRRASVPV